MLLNVEKQPSLGSQGRKTRAPYPEQTFRFRVAAYQTVAVSNGDTPNRLIILYNDTLRSHRDWFLSECSHCFDN